jgi:hypothetical protein
MGDNVTTTDLYEGAFYLLKGCELVLIEGVRQNGSIACRLTFQGEKIARLQIEYFNGATVPLFPFRRAFGQVNALVYSAKKKTRNQMRQAEASAEDRP